MNEFNIEQDLLELLMLITPGPLGQGLTMLEAAIQLGITERAGWYRIVSFKKKYPKEYHNWLSIYKCGFRQTPSLRNTHTISNDMLEQYERRGIIKEVFPHFRENQNEGNKQIQFTG